MLDLSLLLNVSASHETRFNNFDQIFNYYYETLTKTYCSKLNIDTNELPSYFSIENMMKEYAIRYPNSIIIAASFLPILYTPIEGSVFDVPALTEEELIKDVMERGGAPLDKELAHMMFEFYQLCDKFKIEFN